MHATMMNFIISRHLPEGLGAAAVEVYLDTAWASLREDHRALLRKAVRDQVSGDETILDLSELPKSAAHSISISHCKRVGGFALARNDFSIGFDVEVNERLKKVKLDLVMADRNEFEDAPSASVFWTAKEAAFKCLAGPGQPRGLKDIRLGSWSNPENDVHRCEILAVEGREITGATVLVIDDGEMSYAFGVRELRTSIA